MLLKFLQENDNSENIDYDDSTHLAIIIGSLLKVVNKKFVFKIITEIGYFLKLKLVFPSYNFVIIRQILVKYNNFLFKNRVLEHLVDCSIGEY